MSPERARWMTEISAYVLENDLQGREVILYGKIPALSYYLQMPSAFNPWSDLRSYSTEQMALELDVLSEEIKLNVQEKPVIILESTYAAYLTGDKAYLEEVGITDAVLDEMEKDEKWLLIMEFAEAHGYQLTFTNEKFAIFE